jgi:DNA-binding transcriptional regulator YdaS (Cro superfamily)
MKDGPLWQALQLRGMTSRLARELGISTQAISQWDRCPIGRVLEVERVTGIPRWQLRPDYYPQPEMEKAS